MSGFCLLVELEGGAIRREGLERMVAARYPPGYDHLDGVLEVLLRGLER